MRQNIKIQRESTIFEQKCESFGAKSEQKSGFLRDTFGAHFASKLGQNLRLSIETPVRQNSKIKRETIIFASKSEQMNNFRQKDSIVFIHVDNLVSNRSSSVLTVPR